MLQLQPLVQHLWQRKYDLIKQSHGLIIIKAGKLVHAMYRRKGVPFYQPVFFGIYLKFFKYWGSGDHEKKRDLQLDIPVRPVSLTYTKESKTNWTWSFCLKELGSMSRNQNFGFTQERTISLASIAQCIEHRPANLRIPGHFGSRAYTLVVGFNLSPVRVQARGNQSMCPFHINVTLSPCLSPSLPYSLKNENIQLSNN